MRVQFLTRCVRTVHIAAPSSPGPWIARREEYVYWVQWIWSLHKSVNYNENGERHSPFPSPKALLCAQISRWHLRRFRPLSLAAYVRSFCRKYLPRGSTGYACNLRVSRKGRKHASSRRFQNRYLNKVQRQGSYPSILQGPILQSIPLAAQTSCDILRQRMRMFKQNFQINVKITSKSK